MTLSSSPPRGPISWAYSRALGVEREAEQVAMAQRPDLRGHAALREERIVGGHRAVVVEPHDLAEIGLHVLRRRELLAFARGDPQLAVGTERQAMAPVSAARRPSAPGARSP